MKSVLGMTIHDRSPEIIGAVFASLRFPGNRPDSVAVCYDRSPQSSIDAVRSECISLGLNLRETFLTDGPVGFRCPSAAWNAMFDLIDEDHAFCISSDTVLGPHSIDWAYHMAKDLPDWTIVGKADHCGPSYRSSITLLGDKDLQLCSRTMTSSSMRSPLGFAWLLPMRLVRKIEGYSLDFMDGICFEDNDFFLRLWDAGTDVLFFDDVLGLHIEHPRQHCLDEDRVAINRNVFKKKHSERLMNIVNNPEYIGASVWQNSGNDAAGVAVWAHKAENSVLLKIIMSICLYGDGEPWRAIRVKRA